MPRSSHGARLRAPAAAQPVEVDAHPAADPIPEDAAWRVHLGWLRRILSRRFGADAADDLAQDAYLRLAGRPPDAAVRNPRGLLLTIAVNLARDRFRRERVRAEHAARVPEPLSPGGRGWTAEDDLQVREAILSLPPALRETLLLSKIGGLSNREIAQRCGLSVRAVDKRLQKAIMLLVARLRD